MGGGYSSRSAAEKLGVKPGTRLALVAAPDDWRLAGAADDVDVRRGLRGRADVILAFMRSAAEMGRDAARLDRALDDTAALWVAWPRKAAGHVSDVTENGIRDVFLPLGLVDVKVAAIDQDWSGLKLVRRKERRAGTSSR